MRLLYTLLSIYEIILIIRVVMSWVHPDPYHPFVQWIIKLTEPVLAPVRSLLPSNSIGIDFSPLLVFLLIHLIKIFFLSGTVVY
ncbi:MAG TPA: YggT family protein [Spirochaetota bacterium]|nr:YggT family protein [Spirochaetota bacterium]